MKTPSWLGLAISALMFSTSAFALSEASYESSYWNKAIPYYGMAGQEGSFRARDGATIVYRKFERELEQGALVIVPGQGEPSIKYAELIYDLRDLGYSIYILDPRGQGKSSRAVKNPQVDYVRHFDDYVSDLSQFVREVVEAKPHSHRYLLGHSMGGAIVALYLAQATTLSSASAFDAAVLSAPMFEINTKPWPVPVAWGIADVTTTLGMGKAYAVGSKDYDFNARFTRKNHYTSSEKRFEGIAELYRENRDQVIGGVSNEWVKQGLLAGLKIEKLAAQVTTPILILQAGGDQVVKPRRQNRFCAQAAHCELVPIVGSKHEIFEERDAIRDPALEQVREFLQNH